MGICRMFANRRSRTNCSRSAMIVVRMLRSIWSVLLVMFTVGGWGGGAVNFRIFKLHFLYPGAGQFIRGFQQSWQFLPYLCVKGQKAMGDIYTSPPGHGSTSHPHHRSTFPPGHGSTSHPHHRSTSPPGHGSTLHLRYRYKVANFNVATVQSC